MIRFIAAGLALILAAPHAAADPDIKVRITYYDVSGTTSARVRSEIDRLRPADTQKTRRDAVTRWDIRWRFGVVPNATSCVSIAVSVRATIEITLPRLVDPGASAALKSDFTRYQSILLEHEETHARIAAETTRAIDRALRELSGGSDCKRLQADGDATADALVADANRRNAAFDAATDNGAAEGAHFP